MKRNSFLAVLFFFSFTCSCLAQTDSVIVLAHIKGGEEKIIIAVSFSSMTKNPIEIIDDSLNKEFICGFSGVFLQLEKLEDDCFKKFTFDCSPLLENLNLLKKRVVFKNDIINYEFDISTYIDRVKGRFDGVYRIKVSHAFFLKNKRCEVETNWIYLNHSSG